MSDKTILVAFGGISPEHEVSVLSAMQVLSALKDSPYSLRALYITKSGRWLTGDHLLELEEYENLEELEQKSTPCTFSHNSVGQTVLLETRKQGFFSKPAEYPVYAVIPAFHGSEGENGGFQGTCEMYNLPYAGSGILASAIGMDKIKAKELCRAHNIPVVPGVHFGEEQWEEEQEHLLDTIESKLTLPVIVKPATLGSSIGVVRVGTRDDLEEAVETAFRYDDTILVEKAVSPLMEINCAVVGNEGDARASVCERPLGREDTLSFDDKYRSDSGGGKGMASANREIPADIPDPMMKRIQSLSLEIFRTFRASGVARLDFLVQSETGEIFFNEINTIPGSFSFYLWDEDGMNMTDLMLELIEVAVRRHQIKMGRIRSYETNLLSEKAVRGMKGLKGSKP